MDAPTLATAFVFATAIVLVRLLVVRAYATRFTLNRRRTLVVCALYIVLMVPLLLFPFFATRGSQGWPAVWLVGSPILWVVEGGLYYYLARLPLGHAAGAALAANLAQNVLLSLLVWGRDIVQM